MKSSDPIRTKIPTPVWVRSDLDLKGNREYDFQIKPQCCPGADVQVFYTQKTHCLMIRCADCGTPMCVTPVAEKIYRHVPYPRTNHYQLRIA